MLTSIDKALAAAILGLLSLASLYFPAVQAWATPETVAIIVSVITPLVVWAVPNKPQP